MSNLLIADEYGGIKVETVETGWGMIGLWKAQNNLYREALKDPMVAKIVFISESCLPLVPFEVLYRSVMGHDKSIIWLIEKFVFNRVEFLTEVFDR